MTLTGCGTLRRACILALVLCFGAAESWAQERPPADALPGLRDLFPDLGRNALGLAHRESLLPLVVGAGGVVATHPADDDLHAYFARADRLGSLERVGYQAGSTLAVASAVGGLLVVGQLQSGSKFRRFTYDLAQASALTGIITGGMKAAVGRTRPNGRNDVSFPSGHTSSAFTIATVASAYYGWPVAVGGYLGATLVAVSRLDSEQHYLSDVVAGATVGYIVGRTAVRGGNDRYPRLAWSPILSPGTRTVGFEVRWRWGE